MAARLGLVVASALILPGGLQAAQAVPVNVTYTVTGGGAGAGDFVSVLPGGLLVVLVLIAVSCKTARLIETWAPDDYAGAPYKRLMIVGLSSSPTARAQYENDFADKLANHGVLSVASSNVIADVEDIDRKTVESWLAEYRLDGVIVTRVTITKPGRHYAPPHTSRRDGYGAWAVESQAVVEKETFFLEAGLFDAKSEELLYSGVLETKIKDDRTKTIHAAIDRLAADMVERGYFGGA